MIEMNVPWTRVHFTGIGGVGMAGVAHILLDLGVAVSGTDEKDSELLQSLLTRGAKVAIGHDASLVNGSELLVYSSAIQPDNPELQEAGRRAIPIIRRGEFLAELAKLFPMVVCIGGSHGKTTTSAMLSHILREAGMEPGWMIGGMVNGVARNGGAGAGTILVTEVDESDTTQALMKSNYAIVTNIEDDHSWSVGGIEALEDCFRTFGFRADSLFTWSTEATRRIFAGHPECNYLSDDDIQDDMKVGVPGHFNLVNGLLAASVAIRIGVAPDKAFEALRSFKGVQRRMSIRYETPDKNCVVLEDYAHHPTELHATMVAIRENWPEHRLIVVFQPHRFERIKHYAVDFARELSGAFATVVVAPFSAWVEDEEVADPMDIFNAVTTIRGYYTDELPEMAHYLEEYGVIDPNEKTVYAIIGAGDINKAIPGIVNSICARYMEDRIGKLKEMLITVRIEHNKPWSDLTTLGVGRAAPWVAYVDSTDDLEILCSEASNFGIPVNAIGNGSNIVGTDEETDTLWIKLEGEAFEKLVFSYHDIIVGAAVPLRKLIMEMIKNDCCPPELAPLAWIPGQLGGAVRVNAGAHGANMAKLVEHLCGYLPDGTVWMQDSSSMKWGYRNVEGVPRGTILTSFVLRRGPKGSGAEAMEVLNNTKAKRGETQPSGRSAGCIFRNPDGNSAGRLIDSCGLRGLRLNGCYISDVHANFLMAEPGSSSKDFVDLTMMVQQTVFRNTGIVLNCEVNFIGPNDSQRIARQTFWLESEMRRLAKTW